MTVRHATMAQTLGSSTILQDETKPPNRIQFEADISSEEERCPTNFNEQNAFAQWPDDEGIQLGPSLSYFDQVLNTKHMKFEDFSSVPKVLLDTPFYVVDPDSRVRVTRNHLNVRQTTRRRSAQTISSY